MSLADTDENILITTRIRSAPANVFISWKNREKNRIGEIYTFVCVYRGAAKRTRWRRGKQKPNEWKVLGKPVN